MNEILGTCICCGKDIHSLGEDYGDAPNKANFVKLDMIGHPIIHGVYGSTTLDMSTARIIDYELFYQVFKCLRNTRGGILYVCDDCFSEGLNTKFISYDENFFSPYLFLSDSKIKLKFNPEVQEKHLYKSVPRNVFSYSYDEDGPEFIVEQLNRFCPFVFDKDTSGVEYDKENKCINIFYKLEKRNYSEIITLCLKEHQHLVIYGFYEYEVIDDDEFFRRFMRTHSGNF